VILSSDHWELLNVFSLPEIKSWGSPKTVTQQIGVKSGMKIL
jgi:hypothetical protein